MSFHSGILVLRNLTLLQMFVYSPCAFFLQNKIVIDWIWLRARSEVTSAHVDWLDALLLACGNSWLCKTWCLWQVSRQVGMFAIFLVFVLALVVGLAVSLSWYMFSYILCLYSPASLVQSEPNLNPDCKTLHVLTTIRRAMFHSWSGYVFLMDFRL